MESAILENVDKLYRSHVITAGLSLFLIAVAVLVVVGVIKFRLLDSKIKNTALVALVVICSVGLVILQIVEILPVYRARSEQSYVIVENATVVIRDGVTGTVDRTNRVVIYTDEGEIELTMQTDLALDTEVEYRGTVAYLNHSKYLIWYDFT